MPIKRKRTTSGLFRRKKQQQERKEVIVAPRPATGFVSNLRRFKNYPQTVQISQAISLAAQAGTGLINTGFSSVNPDKWFGQDVAAGAGLNFSGASPLQPWAAYAGLFESYKLLEIKIVFTPSRTHLVESSLNFVPIYVYLDPDSVSTASTNSAGIQGRDFRMFRLDKSWSTTYRFPKYNHVRDVGGTGDTMLEGGWMSTSVASSTGHQAGAVMLYAEGATAATSYGQIQVVYTMQVKTPTP